MAAMGWDKPKCLLEVAGQTLLDHALSALNLAGMSDVVIVVGYRRELIERAVAPHPIAPRFVVNDDFSTTNTIHSLWLAREYMDRNLLYFNADVLFDPTLPARLIEHTGSVLAVEHKRCGEEEVKVLVDANARVCGIGKDLPPGGCVGEFIGVAKFDRSICPDFRSILDHYNERLHHRYLFFEAALNDLLDTHVVTAMPLDELRAIEIDTPEDYERAQRLWAGRPGQA